RRGGDRATGALPRARRCVRVGAARIAEPHAVDDDASRIVLGEDPEIERLDLALADPAEPGRERDAIWTGSGPVEEINAHIAASFARARPSSASFVLSAGPSTTSWSRSRSTWPSPGPGEKPSATRSFPSTASATRPRYRN